MGAHDISTAHLVANSCVRCEWRFLGNGEYCSDCLTNPLSDRLEDRTITRTKPENIFEFMGWKFRVRTVDSGAIMICHKRLFNPEVKGAVLSVQYLPANTVSTITMKRGAAWLIAHWWEHYLNICPCLNGDRDDEKGSNFRKTMIDSLLWYDSAV